MDKTRELNHLMSERGEIDVKKKTPERKKPERIILTLVEVARYLRVHPSTVYRLIKHKKLPAFKVGTIWRIDLEAIEQFRFSSES